MTRIPAGRRSKYNARRTVVDGIAFHSAKEAKRYGELKLLEKAGEIRNFRRQPVYDLDAPAKYDGEDNTIGQYIADFVYEERETWLRGQSYETESWKVVIEDVKGFKTPLYRWKKKHFEAQYGIEIRET